MNLISKFLLSTLFSYYNSTWCITNIKFVLFIVIVYPILVGAGSLIVSKKLHYAIQPFIYWSSALYVALSTSLVLYNHLYSNYGTVHLSFGNYNIGWLSFDIAFGVDGVSVLFVILTTYLTMLCIGYSMTSNLKAPLGTFALIYLICWGLIVFFFAVDLFLLYIAFESVVIPLFLLIGIYGARTRRIHAAYQFFFYTLVGSLFMLYAILYIYDQTNTLLLAELKQHHFSFSEQKFLWACFFLGFAIKVPLPPLHIWLPEAHVEAPTVGSVLLAGVVLKMGVYGILKVLWPIFFMACLYYKPFVCTLCLLGMILTALTALRQNDLKKIIAYSSIVHMTYATLGLFTFNKLTMASAIYAMFGHGLISGGLFFLIGSLYERYQSRDLRSYGALARISPQLALIFFIFGLGNMAFPLTVSFPAEVGIFIGLFAENPLIPVIAGVGLLLNSAYTIWLVTRVLFGPYDPGSAIYKESLDLTEREKLVFTQLGGSMFVFGIFPGLIMYLINGTISTLI